jgi:hypothetical protein
MGAEGWCRSIVRALPRRPVRPLGQGEEPEASSAQPGDGGVRVNRLKDGHQAKNTTYEIMMTARTMLAIPMTSMKVKASLGLMAMNYRLRS